MRVIICGGRNYSVKDDAARLFMFQKLSSLHDKYGFSTIIEGGAPGADASAATFAKMKDIPVLTFKADWNEHGRAAGPIRNRKMLEAGKPHLVIAFPGGRGTADMVWQAKDAGVPVLEITEFTYSSRK